MTSEMNSHHWLNFTKLYGPYLIENMYTGQSHAGVEAIELLAILRLTLSSAFKPGMIEDLKQKVLEFAKYFHVTWPETEKCLVLHMLIFHMPATVEYWGPAVSYWNFVEERSVVTISIQFVMFRYESYGFCSHSDCGVLSRQVHRKAGSDY